MPRVAVNRRHTLGLNIAAILVVMVAGELWKTVLTKNFNAINLPDYDTDITGAGHCRLLSLLGP